MLLILGFVFLTLGLAALGLNHFVIQGHEPPEITKNTSRAAWYAVFLGLAIITFELLRW
jgi:hypothetical protein